MNLLQWTVRHARAVVLIVFALAGLGALTALNLPVAIFPNLTIPRIMIAADGGDAPAESVLVGITKPIEAAVSTVPGLRLVQSQTIRGSAGFTLTFGDGTDMANTLQLVNAKLAELQPTLPPGVNVTAERLNPTVFPILDYSVSSKSRSLAEVRNIALNTIRPRIARVNGVAKVLVNGGDVKQMTVTVRPEKLAAYGISVSQISDAINKANAITVTGSYTYQYQRQLVIVSGQLTDTQSVRDVVVSVKNRVPITVGDLADVAEGIQRKTVIATGEGKEAVLINIVRQPDGNTVQVADDVQKEIESMRSSLPADIEIKPFYDQSQLVRESAASVIEAIGIGGALAMLVIGFFLRNLRTAIVALCLLPLTILLTFVALSLMGLSLNIMTLGAMAIALGLVVDDSIVVVEHIFKKLEEGLPRFEAIREGMHEITPAMFASSLATIVVFLPLNMMPGVTGGFFAPLAKTMIATLLISLAGSLTVVPLLASVLFPKLKRLADGHGDPRGIAAVYGRMLSVAIRFKWGVALLVAPLALGSYLLYNGLETGFMPEFDEGAFVIDYKMPAGTSLEETNRVLSQVEDILGDHKKDGVMTWSRLTGAQSGSGLELTPLNQGDILVRLRAGQRAPADKIMDDVRGDIKKAAPNMDIDEAQILGDMIGDLAGSPSPIEVKIFGPDINQLKRLADVVGNKVSKIKGAVDEANGITESGPEAVVKVNQIMAAEQGFGTDTLTNATQGALDGIAAGSIRRGEVLEPILVRYPYRQSYSSEQLQDLPVINPNGQPVPLKSVGDVTVQEGSPELDRENQRLMDSVTARLDKVDLGTGIREVRQALATIPLPPGYSFELGGLYKSQQDSFAALRNVLLAASALVFMVLLFSFRSYRMAAAVFLAAVLALFGVLFALFGTQTALNISSYTGAIMIVGIVTENGILLFEEYRRLRLLNPSADYAQDLVRAGQERLRPILMTTFAAILALLPLALGYGAGAAMQKPLAIAVIGGLTFSTLFTLLFAPVFYSIFHSVKRGLVRNDDTTRASS